MNTKLVLRVLLLLTRFAWSGGWASSRRAEAGSRRFWIGRP